MRTLELLMKRKLLELRSKLSQNWLCTGCNEYKPPREKAEVIGEELFCPSCMAQMPAEMKAS